MIVFVDAPYTSAKLDHILALDVRQQRENFGDFLFTQALSVCVEHHLDGARASRVTRPELRHLIANACTAREVQDNGFRDLS